MGCVWNGVALWYTLTANKRQAKERDTENKLKQITNYLQSEAVILYAEVGTLFFFFSSFLICRVTDWRLIVIMIIKIKFHCILIIAIITVLQVKSQPLSQGGKPKH